MNNLKLPKLLLNKTAALLAEAALPTAVVVQEAAVAVAVAEEAVPLPRLLISSTRNFKDI
jgi:hypothetical protein